MAKPGDSFTPYNHLEVDEPSYIDPTAPNLGDKDFNSSVTSDESAYRRREV